MEHLEDKLTTRELAKIFRKRHGNVINKVLKLLQDTGLIDDRSLSYLFRLSVDRVYTHDRFIITFDDICYIKDISLDQGLSLTLSGQYDAKIALRLSDSSSDPSIMQALHSR